MGTSDHKWSSNVPVCKKEYFILPWPPIITIHADINTRHDVLPKGCVDYMSRLTHHSGNCPWLLDTQCSDHLEDIHSTLSLAALHSIHESTEYSRATHSITAFEERERHATGYIAFFFFQATFL